jgi:hypothetical protein
MSSEWTLPELPKAAPGKRDCYYDTKMPGLELCVTNADAIQSPEFDKDPLCVLANNPGLSIEQARHLAAAVLVQLAAGNNPLHSKRSASNMSLGALFKEYIEAYAKDHTKTWKVMEECFNRYLSHWKSRPINSIKRSDVQLLINKLGKENGNTTSNRTLELLRAVINKGKHWSLITCENPATGISKFKLKPRSRFLHEEELPKLIAAIETETKKDTDIKDYLALVCTREHVNLKSATWVIPDTKNDTADR